MEFDDMLQHIDEFVDQNPRADHLDEAFDVLKQIMSIEIPKFSSIPKSDVDALQHNIGVLFYQASQLFAKARKADIESEITGCEGVSDELYAKLFSYRIGCVEKAKEYWEKSANSIASDKDKVAGCIRELIDLHRRAQYEDDSDAVAEGETDNDTDSSDTDDV